MSTTRTAPSSSPSADASTDTRSAPSIRDATEADLPAIQAIYAHHVLTGVASFEETPPSVDDLCTRLASVRAHGLPYMVAEIDGEVAGYCYATPYRPRAAYRNTIEDSIYVSDAYRGRGLGRVLLQALIERCESGPWRQMVAVIADNGSGGSLSLHTQLGFELTGTLKAVGFKHGRWIDTTLMQRTLGRGDSTMPDDATKETAGAPTSRRA
ncbi:GNAT family N-acetyltransferase [Paraburkholderia strydomiana]|jgi:phosphinothricin acetyltransferase|uniref:GNAT family N-acetyltransferase n=1 Tax=Paraburkholderia strydomiana TaxID=1245417 RepID=A0ABW9EIX4_9BURK